MATKIVDYLRYQIFLQDGSTVTLKSYPIGPVEEVGSYTSFFDMEEGCMVRYLTSNIHHFKEAKLYKEDPKEEDTSDHVPTTKDLIEDLMETYGLSIISEGNTHKIYRPGYSYCTEIDGDDTVVLGWLNGYDPEVPF